MKKARTVLALLLAFVLCMGLLPMGVLAAFFTDTDGHWGEVYIDLWVERDVLHGMGDGTFAPDNGMTRAQAAQVFTNLLKLEAEEDVSDFPDAEGWFTEALAKCVAAGILMGYEDHTMRPENIITRQEFFVMFARAMGIDQAGVDTGEVEGLDGVADWAHDEVAALVARGYVKGTGKGIEPTADITRAQVAALLSNTISTYVYTDNATVYLSSGGLTLVVARNVTLIGEALDVVVSESGSIAVGSDYTVTGYTYTRGGTADIEEREVPLAEYPVIPGGGGTGGGAAITYTVTFDANGGTVNPTSATTPLGGGTVAMPRPTRTGYTFVGWYTEGGELVDGMTRFIDNVTIYAHWTATVYTIRFNGNGGTLDGSATKNVPYGERIGTLPDATLPGWFFAGWFTELSDGTQISPTTKVEGNATYYAHWFAKPTYESLLDNAISAEMSTDLYEEARLECGNGISIAFDPATNTFTVADVPAGLNVAETLTFIQEKLDTAGKRAEASGALNTDNKAALKEALKNTNAVTALGYKAEQSMSEDATLAKIRESITRDYMADYIFAKGLAKDVAKGNGLTGKSGVLTAALKLYEDCVLNRDGTDYLPETFVVELLNKGIARGDAGYALQNHDEIAYSGDVVTDTAKFAEKLKIRGVSGVEKDLQSANDYVNAAKRELQTAKSKGAVAILLAIDQSNSLSSALLALSGINLPDAETVKEVQTALNSAISDINQANELLEGYGYEIYTNTIPENGYADLFELSNRLGLETISLNIGDIVNVENLVGSPVITVSDENAENYNKVMAAYHAYTYYKDLWKNKSNDDAQKEAKELLKTIMGNIDFATLVGAKLTFTVSAASGNLYTGDKATYKIVIE